jgi:hypothetical protein
MATGTIRPRIPAICEATGGLPARARALTRVDDGPPLRPFP